MKTVKLGRSDLEVSVLCLGSMSWGSSNTAAEGHAQIDRSLAAGINFVDTAEMYPTYPAKAETVGNTETIIGDWFARTGRRADVVLATKASDPSGSMFRGRSLDGAVIDEAIDKSLKRLQTDVIDLYQLHAPVRGSYHFRNIWGYDPSGQNRTEVEANMLDTLQGIGRAVDAGKIRYFGLSNETVWGMMMWIKLAEQHDLPRPVSIQNEYSLLCRTADADMSELCCNEDIGLLPFSPLGMGLISGKHSPDSILPGTRREISADLNNRVNDKVWPAVAAYGAIAARHGLDVNAMALAWTLTKPFVTAPIFGARNDAQLDVAISAADLELSDEVIAEIDAAHKAHPMPY